MTCRHCKHAEGRAGAEWRGTWLYCRLHRTAAIRACGDYEREPGADDA